MRGSSRSISSQFVSANGEATTTRRRSELSVIDMCLSSSDDRDKIIHGRFLSVGDIHNVVTCSLR